jgi:nucleotide-binding universal stress UspA family protein
MATADSAMKFRSLVTASKSSGSRSPTAAAVSACDVLASPIEAARADAEAILRRARDQVPDDLPVITLLTDQPVRTALIHQIKEGHHDLVVMGSRGRGAVRSAVLGSVSHYVLHHSPAPVLIVHDDGTPAVEAFTSPAAGSASSPRAVPEMRKRRTRRGSATSS